MIRNAILIPLFWIKLLLIGLTAQSAYNHAQFAQTALEGGDEDLALKEFLRAHFMGEKSPEIPVSKRISDLLAARGDFNLALQYLDYYYFENKGNAQIQGQITLDKVKIHLLENKAKAALYEVFQINANRFMDKDRLYFYTALALFEDHQYTEGFSYLKKISYISPKDYITLDKLSEKLVKNEKRKPQNARWWSIVLPGLGQMIYGDVGDGLTSMALMTGLSFVLIDVALSLNWPNAFLSVGPWWGRYYIGGLGNAEDQARKHKEDKRKALVAEVFDLLQSKK